MEPSACIALFDSNKRLTIWSPSQAPFIFRRKIAEMFDLPVGRVRWITPYVGGNFGNGTSLRGEPICVALAKKTGGPVKLEYTREEQFVTSETRHATVHSGKMGVKKDGTITAIQLKLITDAGAYISQSGGPTNASMRTFLWLYRCPNTAGEADIVYTNTPAAGACRGFGNPQAMWALEQMIDMAAEKIGMDPKEFRLKNHRRAGDPSHIPHLPIESCALGECIRQGAERIGWTEKRGGKKDGVRKCGVGMAIMFHVSGGYPGLLEHTSAFIKLNEDGSATLSVNVCDMGQGILAALAQIAAEELGLRAEDIHLVPVDTDSNPFDVGQRASRTCYVAGNAVQRAAADAKRQLLDRAAKKLEVPADDLEVREGRVYVKAEHVPGPTVAELTKDGIYNFKGDCFEITGKSSFEPSGNPPPFQAAFAEVEVDIQTGEVKVQKIVVAHDIGRAINPITVEGQLDGSIVQAIGYGMTEDFMINKKTDVVETDNFTTYKILSSLDLPETETLLVEQPTPTGPFGAKSVGESGLNAVAPAIANAIYNAVGIRIKDLPITPEKVLHALKGKMITA
jgi:xanthine dehydrogenase molybdenum-binding subunit